MTNRTWSDARAERLLNRPAAAEGELSAFVAAVAMLAQPPPEPSGALALLLRDGVAAGAVTERALTRRAHRRRSLVGVLAASVVALVGTGTAASAGVLPAPLQSGVRAVVEAVTPFEVPAPAGSRPSAPASGPPAPSMSPGVHPTALIPVPTPAPTQPGAAASASSPGVPQQQTPAPGSAASQGPSPRRTASGRSSHPTAQPTAGRPGRVRQSERPSQPDRSAPGQPQTPRRGQAGPAAGTAAASAREGFRRRSG